MMARSTLKQLKFSEEVAARVVYVLLAVTSVMLKCMLHWLQCFHEVRHWFPLSGLGLVLF